MAYEISFDGPGVAFRTLNANRFVTIFAEKLHQLFTASSTELLCHLQVYRDSHSFAHLKVQWRDGNGRAFDYKFQCTGYGGWDYNIDTEGCYRIESGDTMTAGDLCDALSYIDQIHHRIVQLRHGEARLTMAFLPTTYFGGEEPWPS